MRVIGLILAFLASTSAVAKNPSTIGKDEALKNINACLQRNEMSSRECKNINANVEALTLIYSAGDKTVLPALFKFTYLTNFFDDALIADTEGFLTALAELPVAEQTEAMRGIAGGMFKIGTRDRFENIRQRLTAIPDSSPNKYVARRCLKAVETGNAAYFVDYFPPLTLTSRAADFELFWYSREMYALGEKPLWRYSPERKTTYRLTHLGSFTGPKSVSLTVAQDGTGQLASTVLNPQRDQETDTALILGQEKVLAFLSKLDEAQFWSMSTESMDMGLDGADWILEVAKDNSYHVVVRWCPGAYSKSVSDAKFAEAGRMLFEFAGQKHTGNC